MAGAVRVTKIDLQNEVAKALVNEGTRPPVDFKTLNNPLRIEIEMLLRKIPVDASVNGKNRANRRARNADRTATVMAYLTENYPDNKNLCESILSDLCSYQGWEDEVTPDA